MRNVWKGLVIGGLTGSLVGIVMDALRRENLEEVGRRARTTSAAMADKVRTADLQDRVREYANSHR